MLYNYSFTLGYMVQHSTKPAVLHNFIMRILHVSCVIGVQGTHGLAGAACGKLQLATYIATHEWKLSSELIMPAYLN